MLSNKENSDKLIFYSFLALIAWLPLPFGSNRPWAEAIMEVWVFSLMLVWMLGFIRGKFQTNVVLRKALPVLFFFLSWLIWILIQTIPLPVKWVTLVSPSVISYFNLNGNQDFITISLDAYATAEGLLKSLSYLLFFLLTLLLVTSPQRLRQLAYVIIYSGLFQAVYGSLMTLSGLAYGFFIHNPLAINVATGTFINRNHYAGYLVMALSVGIGMMIANLDTETISNGKMRLRKYMQLMLSSKLRLRLYLVVMVIALVLTHSRMGNTSFFLSLIIVGGMGLLLSRHATHKTIILLTSLIVIDVFIVGTWFGLEKVAERVEQTTLATEIRDDVDIYVYDQWKDFQIVGSGLGSFYSVFPKYNGKDVRGFHDHTHNDYLEIISETGLIGIVLLGLVVAMSLYVAVVAQYQRKHALMRGISFAAIMCIFAVLLHATVEFNLQIPANAATFMVILSMGWIAYGLIINRVKRGRYGEFLHNVKN